MSAVISCHGATRRYPRNGTDAVVAVRDVDLEVQSGEFVAIQGPSGSGKTTLLGLLAGLESADEGTVSVLGHDLARLSLTERARLRRSRMGIVFQSFGLVASLTAGENVALPLALAGIDRAERRERAALALAEVGLGGGDDRRTDELSGGERQRVGVARAIAGDPTLVLADEPTGSLDDENAAAILDLLTATVRKRGASLVLVTHDPESAARADRSIRMRDGAFLNGDT
jgi:putative ABC transport system ATP-binding protein